MQWSLFLDLRKCSQNIPSICSSINDQNKLSEAILIDLQASVYILEEHQKLIQPMR